MKDYITYEDLTEILTLVKDSKSDLEEYKSRSKTYVVPERYKSCYIELTYVEWLCRYLQKKFPNKQGCLNLQGTIHALTHTNWTYKSYNHFVYWTNEDLSRHLLKTKAKYWDSRNRKARLEMLEEQAEYLNRAVTWLAGALDAVEQGAKKIGG